jgi:hypothetical protein
VKAVEVRVCGDDDAGVAQAPMSFSMPSAIIRLYADKAALLFCSIMPYTLPSALKYCA